MHYQIANIEIVFSSFGMVRFKPRFVDTRDKQALRRTYFYVYNIISRI